MVFPIEMLYEIAACHEIQKMYVESTYILCARQREYSGKQQCLTRCHKRCAAVSLQPLLVCPTGVYLHLRDLQLIYRANHLRVSRGSSLNAGPRTVPIITKNTSSLVNNTPPQNHRRNTAYNDAKAVVSHQPKRAYERTTGALIPHLASFRRPSSP